MRGSNSPEELRSNNLWTDESIHKAYCICCNADRKNSFSFDTRAFQRYFTYTPLFLHGITICMLNDVNFIGIVVLVCFLSGACTLWERLGMLLVDIGKNSAHITIFYCVSLPIQWEVIFTKWYWNGATPERIIIQHVRAGKRNDSLVLHALQFCSGNL